MALLDKLKNLLPGQTASASTSARSGGLNRKAAMVGGLLIVSVLITVVAFVYQGEQSGKNRLYITIASELQVISQQIAVNALEASAGRIDAFDRLAENQNRFLAGLDKYNRGDSTQGLPPLPPRFTSEFSALKALWNDYDKDIATVVAAKTSIGTVSTSFSV